MKSLRIALDCRKLGDFGIGTHISGLLTGLRPVAEEVALLLLAPRERHGLVDVPSQWRWIAAESPGYSLRELFEISRLARLHRVHLLHLPHYPTPLQTPCPLVVTLHDLIHWKRPGDLPHPVGGVYARFMLRRAVRLATRVICVSESVRREVQVELEAEASKLLVIPNGVAEEFFERPGPERDDPVLAGYELTRQSYLLVLANPKPHKNLERLLRAWASIEQELPGHLELVLAGAREADRLRLRERIRSLGSPARVRLLGHLPERHLVSILRGALALVAVSLEEGFGLPAVEAQAAGVPVVASRLPVSLEVTGGHAVFVDPYRIADIAAGLRRIVGDARLREELSVGGAEWARRYSWSSAARRTLEVYRQVAGRKGSEP